MKEAMSDDEYAAREARYDAQMRADMDSYPMWRTVLELALILAMLGGGVAFVVWAIASWISR